MTPERGRELLARLSVEERAALEAGPWCRSAEPKLRPQRKARPAGLHRFTPCRISTNDGLLVRCVSGCQEERHRVRAALMGGSPRSPRGAA